MMMTDRIHRSALYAWLATQEARASSNEPPQLDQARAYGVAKAWIYTQPVEDLTPAAVADYAHTQAAAETRAATAMAWRTIAATAPKYVLTVEEQPARRFPGAIVRTMRIPAAARRWLG